MKLPHVIPIDLNIHGVVLMSDTEAYETETLRSFPDHDLKVTFSATSCTTDDVYRFAKRSVQGRSFAILVALKTISAWCDSIFCENSVDTTSSVISISEFSSRRLSVKLG